MQSDKKRASEVGSVFASPKELELGRCEVIHVNTVDQISYQRRSVSASNILSISAKIGGAVGAYMSSNKQFRRNDPMLVRNEAASRRESRSTSGSILGRVFGEPV